MQKVWEYNKVQYIRNKLESFINLLYSKYPNICVLCITVFLGILNMRFRRLEVDDVIDATVRLF